jgi:hypothetical protein
LRFKTLLENAGLSDAIKEVTTGIEYNSKQTSAALAAHTDYETYIPRPNNRRDNGAIYEAKH